MAQAADTFGISVRLQEMMCKVGQGYVFEEGEQLFMEMMGISVSARQLQRVSEYYGKKIGERDCTPSENPVVIKHPPVFPRV